MPAPGEQHRASAASANPFEESKPHINEYTAQEVATLQSRLEKQLGPEYISSRPGAGGQKVHYLAAEKCINLANEVFGFNGWSSGIRDVTVDFIDESQSTGKITLGLSVIVRVTLRDGTYHEDIGYGHIENCKGKAAAFEKAKKEGTTDALKRALRNFGNILGNCIYDKDYLARVTKLKIAPVRLISYEGLRKLRRRQSKWDSENLHRHVDYAPIKRESIADADDSRLSNSDSGSTTKENDDEFGGADFDEVDFNVTNGEHPDEVTLDAPTTSAHFSRKASPIKHGPTPTFQNTNNNSNGQQPRPPPARMQPIAPANTNGPPHSSLAPVPNNPQISRQPLTGQHNQANMHRPPQVNPQAANYNRPQGPTHFSAPSVTPAAVNPVGPPYRHHDPSHAGVQTLDGTPPLKSSGPMEGDQPVGFFTARAAESLQKVAGIPPNIPQFNPHAESPSIRKTAGVDHTKTKPVGREMMGAAAPSLPPIKANFVNPQADQARRIGMPNTAGSPLQNRNSYKPPQMTMKRPAENNGPQFNRPVLNDVTSVSANAPIDTGGGGNKRPKITHNGQSLGTGTNIPAI
ncbi:DNA repair protein rad52 [Xylographa bjoerkii]|nr:DNA repair protein rad52 [Xylographa bjoerkii]